MQTIDSPGKSEDHPLLCIADATHFTSLNSEWERVLGWTKKELLVHPFTDFVHPDDVQRTIEIAGKVRFPDYEVAEFENRYFARDGGWRWLRWTAKSDGAHWIAVAHDTTDEHARSAPAAPAKPSPDGRRGPSAMFWYMVVVLAAVSLAVGATQLPEIHFSGATSPPSWGGADGPPAMTGPLMRSGPIESVGPSRTHRAATRRSR